MSSSLLGRRGAVGSIDPASLPKASALAPSTSSSSSGGGGSTPANNTTTATSSSTPSLLRPAPLSTSSSSRCLFNVKEAAALQHANAVEQFATMAKAPPPTSSNSSSTPTTTTSLQQSSIHLKSFAFSSGRFGAGSLTSSSFSFPSTSTSTSSAPAQFAPSAPSTNLLLKQPANEQPAKKAGLFGGTLPFSGASTTGTSLFGSSNATKPATTTTGGLFGSTTGGLGGGLGLQQQQQPQAQQQLQQQQLIQQMPIVRAMANPQVMGNDNDRFIAYINQVAGGLGVGKAPYKDNNTVRTFDMEGNVLQRFVSIGYNKISERTDDEGFVTMVLGYPIHDLNTEERRTKVLEVIQSILGNAQNVQVQYAPGTSLRALADGCTELTIIVKEGGFVVGACKLAQVLNDAPRMAQLEQQLKADKTRVLPKVGMSKAQKDHYLETVPEGVDANLWAQAKAENPAPHKLLPVVVRGWEQLRDRQKAQMQETKIYTDAMDTLGDRIEQAVNEHAKAKVTMEMIRNRHKQLSYRLIRILLAQWIASRYSRQIDTDEDRIHAKCDTLLAQMNRHNQVKYWIDKFYKVIEEKPEKLKETMFTMFDMSMEDEKYALRFLTQMVYICEELYNTSNLQVSELEECRKALEG